MTRTAEPDKLDCLTKVVTPENIQFVYTIAGPFQRLPAYLVDVAIWSTASLILFFVGSVLAALFGFSGLGELFVFAMLVIYFVLSWFYGVFFETYFHGRTPGKAMFGLRAIGVDGRPINGLQAGLRNLLRSADLNVMLSLQLFFDDMPPVYIVPTMLVGLVVMLSTERMQRIGDLAAGTMVIADRRQYSVSNILPDDVRAYGLAELIPPTFEVSQTLAQSIGLYMENRGKLSMARREEVASRLARPLLKRFGLIPDTGSDLLLCSLYVRIFLTEPQRAQGQEQLRRVTQASWAAGSGQIAQQRIASVSNGSAQE